MFKHKHPYKPFIQSDTKKLIVGTLPPPRFSTGELLEKDVDFCYGSYYNSLWLFIDKIHNLNLRYDNSNEAIDQRKAFLIKHKIGVCDIVESAEREKIDASDLGMKNIILRDIVGYLKQYPSIETILFTGGNSKNGPEYFFRKHLKDYNLKLELVNNEVPRIHKFSLCQSEPKTGSQTFRTIETVSLTSGSGAANISISRLPLYKQLKSKNPNFNTFDFRVMQYAEFF
ncbi:uracil-DNA glycosylase family protein [Winogradskyella echinorum]|uniref:Uracil-DNA glycosylase family protein n=1 Tax=Winogradskyella echinorum TaxID=538189 RepID=A0ABR6Y3J9_9FLAO|nr:uracil-DNA glycosylase family protein [Winogradskyella echinorum]MBC3847330.1 uracil-DNA glycosylase family protein [Winogradskyella echinorum]MBC5751678.1 uracil-DNA glycosylase family protein [Winogradskyella echinorum]